MAIKSSHSRNTVILAFCFFLSGATSLLYEIVWMRELTLIFGSTQIAVGIILALFMGGLALGSWLAGRVSLRISNPIFVYGILEAVIGIYALAAYVLFKALPGIYPHMVSLFGHSFVLLTFVKTIAIGLFLILPTASMGATLPLVSEALKPAHPQAGKVIGTIYGMNILGAVVGTIVTGFLLIPGIGMMKTVWVGAAVNLGLAGLLLVYACGIVPSLSRHSERSEESLRSFGPAGLRMTGTQRILLLVLFFSGFISMAHEVAWTRALVFVIGNSTYAFTSVLICFLLGLALGTLFFSRLAKKFSMRFISLLAFLQVLSGLAGLAALAIFPELPYQYLVWLKQFWFAPYGFAWVQTGFAMLVVFPISFFQWGMFPFILQGWAERGGEAVSRSTGNLYAINTAGSIAGALMASLLFLPWIGTYRTILLGALLSLGLAGLLFLSVSDFSFGKRVRYTFYIGINASVGGKPYHFRGFFASEDTWVRQFLSSALDNRLRDLPDGHNGIQTLFEK